jgi:hypothetical protein
MREKFEVKTWKKVNYCERFEEFEAASKSNPFCCWIIPDFSDGVFENFDYINFWFVFDFFLNWR